MKEPEQEINHSAAPSVTSSAQQPVILRLMKESTLVISHSAVLSVTINAQDQVL